ncbi:YraN family protein [Candidatus Azambacteria bacterium]|nr:YraN family protein [Candidatus Azambacteria bacterium]
MPSKKRKFGDIGEDVARKYLVKIGYSIIGKNYQTKFGEIDIVAKNDREILFIEVKTSDINSFIRPEENLTQNKLRKLLKTVELYIISNDLPETYTWRVDLISIKLNQETRKASLEHFKGIS